jgi:Flp pilus assembly pilin Flp
MAVMFRRLWDEQSGMTTVEYALLLALLTLASVVAWTNLGNRKTAMLGIVNDAMD